LRAVADIGAGTRLAADVDAPAVCAGATNCQEQARETLCIVRTGNFGDGHGLRSLRAMGRRSNRVDVHPSFIAG
jgi:hypothetical protein